MEQTTLLFSLLIVVFVYLEHCSVVKCVQMQDVDVQGGFGAWLPWSPCNHRCKQKRYRKCLVKEICQGQKILQRRNCLPKSQDSHAACLPERSEVSREGEKEYGRALARENVEEERVRGSFSQWSIWSRCTRSCRKRRFSYCTDKKICGQKVFSQEKKCAPKGSFCEQRMAQNQEEKEEEKKEEKLPKTETPSDSVHNESALTVAGFNDSSCGLREIVRPSNRIYGGVPSHHGKWPWQVALLNRFKEPYCGGTLIANQWVLTAAHCIKRKFFVLLGDHNFRAEEGTEQLVRVVEAYRYPGYDVDTYDNDIGLVKLAQAVDANAYVRPACMPDRRLRLAEDTGCYVTGWGKKRNTHSFGTDVLHEAHVPIVDHKRCKSVYDNFDITNNMLCAGYSQGTADSCGGDSGGPLLCEVGGRWLVYGITSFGEGCGDKDKFGVYSRVPNYAGWVRRVIDGMEQPSYGRHTRSIKYSPLHLLLLRLQNLFSGWRI